MGYFHFEKVLQGYNRGQAPSQSVIDQLESEGHRVSWYGLSRTYLRRPEVVLIWYDTYEKNVAAWKPQTAACFICPELWEE